MNAPKGHYRKLLKLYPDVRIAFTHTPIIGCTIVDNAEAIKELEKSDDEYAQYYIDGLRNGAMVTIVENNCNKEYWSSGELYFRT